MVISISRNLFLSRAGLEPTFFGMDFNLYDRDFGNPVPRTAKRVRPRDVPEEIHP